VDTRPSAPTRSGALSQEATVIKPSRWQRRIAAPRDAGAALGGVARPRR